MLTHKTNSHPAPHAQLWSEKPIGAPVCLGSSVLERMGARMVYERNTEIYGEEEPSDFLYKVLSGAVRTSKLLSDGRRQISAFHLPGELFGLEPDAVHAFSAEAVVNTQVLVLDRRSVMAMAERDGEIARELWSFAARDLTRARNHMLVLGRKTALERVASFLVEMVERSSEADAVELPMSRYDIADYLGLTIETVSRTLTQLADDGLITLASARRIRLSDPGALYALNV